MRMVMFVNADWVFLTHRLALARRLRDLGVEVIVAAGLERGHQTAIEGLGFRFVPIPMQRGSRNPLTELAAVRAILDLYRRERPDFVHQFNAKPILYGSLAARLTGVRAVVDTIPGLGPLFDTPGVWGMKLRMVSRVYAAVFAGNRVRVIVQNPDDRREMLDRGIVPDQRLTLIRGSGVDVHHWTPGEEGTGTPTVILASRLIWAKGLAELAEASRQLRRDGVAVRVLVAGEPDPESRDRVPAETLRAWEAEGLIEWIGFRDDLRDVVRSAAFAVLPSYYKEGVPKSLLEALAAGKPILTTDAPGCREVVVPGENGLLVPPRDAPSLACAMKRLLADRALRARMGARSRAMALEQFSDDSVNARIIDVYREVLGDRWRPSPSAAGGGPDA